MCVCVYLLKPLKGTLQLGLKFTLSQKHPYFTKVSADIAIYKRNRCIA